MNYNPHPTCQIPCLAALMAERFGFRTDGTFVEVGAFDGLTCSNTSFLSDVGWRGLYIEPVPAYAAACARQHAGNPRVSVVSCAIGPEIRKVTLEIGGVLTTADAELSRAYGEIEWARGLRTTQKIVVDQVRLESILLAQQIPRCFEVLVVDVEGGEEGVFQSFDLDLWRPRMMIVELEDEHPSFGTYPGIRDRARRLRSGILDRGYTAIYQDSINTVFWDDASGGRAGAAVTASRMSAT